MDYPRLLRIVAIKPSIQRTLWHLSKELSPLEPMLSKQTSISPKTTLSCFRTMRRCLGVSGGKKGSSTVNGAFIKTLRTVAEPAQAMPRLVDLLDYLAQPGNEDIWLLLDIKVSK